MQLLYQVQYERKAYLINIINLELNRDLLMSTRYLDRFFQPRSIAIIGASEKPYSMGGIVLKNLLNSAFQGELFAVNAKNYTQVFGVPCYSHVRYLPTGVDLVILCTPSTTIPKLIKELGECGHKAVLILTGGISRTESKSHALWTEFQKFFSELVGIDLTEQPRLLRELLWEVANKYDMRLMGPNCIGILSPTHKMNASYAHLNAGLGKIAFVGQSGILGHALLDWASSYGIGFYHFTTLGDSIEVDFSDLIDYFVQNSEIKIILLHIENLQNARRFFSAIHAAARKKLVVALKAGRFPESQEKALPLPLGVQRHDSIYDALLRRAGVLRLAGSHQLFDTLSTLTRMKALHGERLAIISNGLGATLLAIDALLAQGGQLAELSPQTVAALIPHLPRFWTRKNPIDLNADATPARYSQVLAQLAQDPQIDAILVIYGCNIWSDALAVAQAVIQQPIEYNILAAWMGGTQLDIARQALDQANIPTFITPEEAVSAFMQMVQHRRNQVILHETPPLWLAQHLPDRQAGWEVIHQVEYQKRQQLTPAEAQQLLQSYHLESAPDFSNVFLTENSVIDKLPLWFHVTITQDVVVGAVMLFNVGGQHLTEAKLELLPINLKLARELIQNSPFYSLILSQSANLEQDIHHLATVLVQVAQIVVDIALIHTLHLEIVLHPTQGIQLSRPEIYLGQTTELAIQPYPEELKILVQHPAFDVPLEIRPIRAEDEPAHDRFVRSLSPETLHYRFFHTRHSLSHLELAQLTQIDYAREMAFIAVLNQPNQLPETLGVARAYTDADNIQAEFAIVVSDHHTRKGLGKLLLTKLIEYCRERGTLQMIGTVLSENRAMLTLAKHLGFKSISDSRDPEVQELFLTLNATKEIWQQDRLWQ